MGTSINDYSNKHLKWLVNGTRCTATLNGANIKKLAVGLDTVFSEHIC